jgi:hypothetical protein
MIERVLYPAAVEKSKGKAAGPLFFLLHESNVFHIAPGNVGIEPVEEFLMQVGGIERLHEKILYPAFELVLEIAVFLGVLLKFGVCSHFQIALFGAEMIRGKLKELGQDVQHLLVIIIRLDQGMELIYQPDQCQMLTIQLIDTG